MNGAYYNEHDPFAAAWLRSLIARGLIAPGHVDERDVRIVQPDDLRGFAQCHFFAGIGGWAYALRLAGWPDDRPVWTGSCPCQPFSSAGKRQGADDARHLWPTWVRLIRECRPPVVFGEQVASPDGVAWLDTVSTDLEAADYAFGSADLPAAGVGAPHIRQRLWFVAESHGSERSAGRLGGTDGRTASEPPGLRAPRAMADAAGTRSEGRPESGGSGPGQSAPEGARRLCGDIEPPRDGATGRVADAERGRRQGDERRTRTRLQPEPARSGGLVYAAGAGRPRGVEGPEAARLGRPGVVEASTASGLADGDGERLTVGPESDGGAVEPGEFASRRRDASGCGVVDDAERNGRDSGGGGDHAGHVGLVPDAASPWADIVWLPCRDGKDRPTKPGLFPLASGIPGRVGLLRGSGNAIVPQVAALFIAAYQEARG